MIHPREEEPAPPARLGRYELISLLGRGGMAEVYAARLPGALGVQKRVAVKRILPEALQNPDFVKLFVREARICTRLMHPNLIQVFELGQAGQELFLAMELVEGCDLRQVLLAHRRLGKVVPLELALFIMHGVLLGLEHAHRLTDEQGAPLNVVHRDLSPGNVLLSYAGAVKVADFGVAHVDGPEKSDANLLKGKISYMAPEQLTGQGVDERVDVFAAGCVLFEMLSGQPVYGGQVTPRLVRAVARGEVPDVRRAIRGIDPALAAVLQRALARDREARTPTCERFDAELMELVQGGRLRMAREAELALYLEVLIPRPEILEEPPAVEPSLPTQIAPPPPRPEPESVVELGTCDLVLDAPELASIGELLRAPESSSRPALEAGDLVLDPPEPRSIGDLFRTPPPGIVVEPLERPVEERISPPVAAPEAKPVRSGPRRATALLAVLAMLLVAASAIEARSPAASVPPAPFVPVQPALKLDAPALELALPDLKPAPVPAPTRRSRRGQR